jgi:hypothetical protein
MADQLLPAARSQRIFSRTLWAPWDFQNTHQVLPDLPPTGFPLTVVVKVAVSVSVLVKYSVTVETSVSVSIARDVSVVVLKAILVSTEVDVVSVTAKWVFTTVVVESVVAVKTSVMTTVTRDT